MTFTWLHAFMLYTPLNSHSLCILHSATQVAFFRCFWYSARIFARVFVDDVCKFYDLWVCVVTLSSLYLHTDVAL